MPKTRKSSKEAKKKPIMTMKEKRAVRKSKKEAKLVLDNDNAMRSATTVSGIRRP